MRAQSKDNETKSQTKLFTTIPQPNNLPTYQQLNWRKKISFFLHDDRRKCSRSFLFTAINKKNIFYIKGKKVLLIFSLHLSPSSTTLFLVHDLSGWNYVNFFPFCSCWFTFNLNGNRMKKKCLTKIYSCVSNHDLLSFKIFIDFFPIFLFPYSTHGDDDDSIAEN